MTRWRAIRRTSNSGKRLYVCLCCGRVSPIADKSCPTPGDGRLDLPCSEYLVGGPKSQDVESASIDLFDEAERLNPDGSGLTLASVREEPEWVMSRISEILEATAALTYIVAEVVEKQKCACAVRLNIESEGDSGGD